MAGWPVTLKSCVNRSVTVRTGSVGGRTLRSPSPDGGAPIGNVGRIRARRCCASAASTSRHQDVASRGRRPHIILGEGVVSHFQSKADPGGVCRRVPSRASARDTRPRPAARCAGRRRRPAAWSISTSTTWCPAATSASVARVERVSRSPSSRSQKYGRGTPNTSDPVVPTAASAGRRRAPRDTKLASDAERASGPT